MQYNKVYAGIGSRKTPSDVLDQMWQLAHELKTEGWLLRSGGAEGADENFELGAQNCKEVFRADGIIPDKAFEIAEELHPAWHVCSPYAKRLLARNMQQVLGQNLDSPVDFVVCWTSDGCESHETRTRKTGGTGQAISLASLLDIPVFNLANEERLNRVRKYIE